MWFWLDPAFFFSKCLEAAKLLAVKSKSATVINNPFVNRVDLETIGAAVQACGGRLVTIEDHQVVGGIGAQVSRVVQRGHRHRVKSLGIHGGPVGLPRRGGLYVKHGLTGPKMAEAALGLIQ